MFGLMNMLFPVMFVLFFILFIVFLVWMIVSGLRQWHKNNNSPRLTVEAQVVTKRISVHHHHNANNVAMDHSSTTHYVTFQVESGDRMEFSVSGSEYGMLAEDDRGRLTFQGTRYLGFERQR